MDIKHTMSQAYPGTGLHDRIGKLDKMVQGKRLMFTHGNPMRFRISFLFMVTGNPQGGFIDKINGYLGIPGPRDGFHRHRHLIVIPGDFRIPVVHGTAHNVRRFFPWQQWGVSWFQSKLVQVVHGCSEFIEFIID
jgi:hypothetical protein